MTKKKYILAVRVDNVLRKKLEILARREERSLSSFVRSVLKREADTLYVRRLI